MIKTTIANSALVKAYFSSDLLLGFLERSRRYFDRILGKASKKIRPCDVGKIRELKELKKRFHELYERKKAEEKAIRAETEKENEKRSPLPTQKTVRFRRYIQLPE